MKLPNIVVRILSGIVFVSLLLGGILFNEYTFAALFTLITGLALFEFYGLLQKNSDAEIVRWYNVLGGVVLFLSGYFIIAHQCYVGLMLYIAYLLFLFVSELYLKHENPIKSLGYALLGQIYIAVPFTLANYLVFAYNGEYHSVYLMALLIFIWIDDSFAYLTGMAFGRHRLFERISPKKSWEGFIGGAIFTIGSSLIFAHFFEGMSTITWLGFAAIVVAFGTWGDLIESLIKRTLGVKDSGNMIPGHGGMLDRFDSTIFAIPAVFLYLFAYTLL